MNTYKFSVLLKEFPFLKEILVFWPEKFPHLCKTREEIRERVIEVTQKYSHMIGFEVYYDETENEGYVHPSFVEVPGGLQIKLADRNLLSQTPESDSYSWCNGGYHNYTDYYVITMNGEYSTTKLDVAETWANGSGECGSTTAATIGEQLFQKKLEPDFIVSVDFQDTDANGNGESSLGVVIYKLKKFNLKKYHKEQIARVVAELNAEIETATT